MRIKVRSNTADRLALVLKPQAGVILVPFAIMLCAIAAFIIWVLGAVHAVTVTDGVLRYEQRFLGGEPTLVFSTPAEAVTDVDIVEETTLGFIRTNQIRLRTEARVLLLNLNLADGREKRLLADEIRWAVSPEGRAVEGIVFSHEDDATGSAFILSAPCLIGAIIALRALQTVIVIGDRRSARLRLRKRRTLSLWGAREDIPISEISGVHIVAFTLTTPRGLSNTIYEVKIDLRSGKAVSVAFGPMFTEESAIRTKALLDDWLSWPAF
jgi:hypothetical protein